MSGDKIHTKSIFIKMARHTERGIEPVNNGDMEKVNVLPETTVRDLLRQICLWGDFNLTKICSGKFKYQYLAPDQRIYELIEDGETLFLIPSVCV